MPQCHLFYKSILPLRNVQSTEFIITDVSTNWQFSCRSTNWHKLQEHDTNDQSSEGVAQNLCSVLLKPSKINEKFLLGELGMIQNLSKLSPKLTREKKEQIRKQ